MEFPGQRNHLKEKVSKEHPSNSFETQYDKGVYLLVFWFVCLFFYLI